MGWDRVSNPLSPPQFTQIRAKCPLPACSRFPGVRVPAVCCGPECSLAVVGPPEVSPARAEEYELRARAPRFLGAPAGAFPVRYPVQVLCDELSQEQRQGSPADPAGLWTGLVGPAVQLLRLSV